MYELLMKKKKYLTFIINYVEKSVPVEYSNRAEGKQKVVGTGNRKSHFIVVLKEILVAISTQYPRWDNVPQGEPGQQALLFNANIFSNVLMQAILKVIFIYNRKISFQVLFNCKWNKLSMSSCTF